MLHANYKQLNNKINLLKSFIDKLTPKQVDKLVNGSIDDSPFNRYFSIVIQVIFNEMIDGQPIDNQYIASLLIDEIKRDILSVIKHWYDKANVNDDKQLISEFFNCKNYIIGSIVEGLRMGKDFRYKGRKLGTLKFVLNDKATKCLIDDDDEY